MSSKEKDSKNFPARLKEFFKKGALGTHPGKLDYYPSQDIIRDISKETSLPLRLKALKDLAVTVEQEKLGNYVVEKLWSCTEDLFAKENPAEARHMVFFFMQALVKGQMERLSVMRAQFFRLIKHHDHPEDVLQKLDLLIALTQNGKVILFFEEEIGRFLLNWLPEISRVGGIEKYLTMIDNTIRFNAAYLDEEIINGFIEHMCVLCTRGSPPTTIISCLQIMSSIVAYSNMSPDALPKFIGGLCRTVMDQRFCEKSWHIMKNLLGTHMGHSTIYTMCRILQEPVLRPHIDLLRGAVFFTRMGLWTVDPFPNLRCPPSSILPSFVQALTTNHPAVAYEVAFAIQQLVNRHGMELLDSSWSAILQIISQSIHIANTVPYKLEYKSILMSTMNTMEWYIEHNKYHGNLKSYYDLVEECAVDRPDESLMKLLEYLSINICPVHHWWLNSLHNLVHRYFRSDMRSTIRIKVLWTLTHVYKINREPYEEDLMERIIIPYMTPAINDSDVSIRISVIKMLLDFCRVSDSKRCLDLLDILEKFLFRPFEAPAHDNYDDIVCLVHGLNSLFIRKLYNLPSSHAIRVFTILVTFLEKHYEMPLCFQGCSQVRYAIFDCFLKMRADSIFHLGYPDNNRIVFSQYLSVVYRNSLNSPPPQSPAVTSQSACTVTNMPLRKAFRVIITCLRSEKDWDVLNLVLTGISKGLQNKSLVLGKGNNELDLLVGALCAMVSDRTLNLPESLNVKVHKPDFHTIISLVLVNLASYHAYLDNPSQTKMIRCIMKCIISAPKSSKPCISALMVCTLEMKEVMVKILPSVLLDLSKMSPTNHVAVPVLEFLSTMTQLPSIFANFVADQYMAVFAVALAYSNPFKFNHYIVSLAHHVIALWFLKCRLTFRRDFVSFIITGLKANLQPYEETIFHKLDLTSANQDSSDRKRSSSLTEQGSRRRDERTWSVRMDKGAIKKTHIPSKLVGTFYEELNETCVDLMARYVFSPCTALPRRTPLSEFLLRDGQSMTWLVGNKLVRVTTSGCSQKVLRRGLCEDCWSRCNAMKDNNLLAAGSSSTETSRQNSNEKSNNSASSPQEEATKGLGQTEEGKEEYLCPCWLQGFAEVHIRRPTGDMSWIMRIQNDLAHSYMPFDFPLKEVANLYKRSTQEEPPRPSLVRQDTFDENQSNCDDDLASGQGSPRQTPSRQNSQDSIEEENDEIIYEDGSRSRNPVRRSNSSPEMSAGWKNPFHKMGSSSGSSEGDSSEEKKGKMYSKDMRVSCEAIPEEIAGTSPPQTDTVQSSHPSLHSYYSFPGSAAPNEAASATGKMCQTVPPSPGLQTNISPLEFPGRPTAIGGLQPLTGKPPQSPTQTSPRLARHINKGGQELQKSSSSSVVLDRTSHLSQLNLKERKSSGSTERLDSGSYIRRDRLNTISVMSRPKPESNKHPNRSKEPPKSGVHPSFVFLQLYHNFCSLDQQKYDRPLLIGTSDVVTRAVKNLDKIPPYETHTVGVLYIGEGQVNNEVEILKNCFGSMRYIQFLDNLGTLARIADTEPHILGGLDQQGGDGKYVYIWEDDVVRMTYHVATLMPNKETDPNCNNKKMHIGNDYVNIIYNESGEEFDMKTIKSQFNFASIIIQPLDHSINRVTVKIKDELKDLAVVGNDPKVVSDDNVAILARQLALHANLASLVARSLQSSPNDPYASNWLERLRQIKNVRKKVLDEQKNEDQNIYPSEESKRYKPIEDFTDYS
ncbi:tuberin isoform X2 [Euwallacea fornicatus]|uniref:tuberin isoform X2 n=1 Tax=Euwallacea fornicatus TaxID=995702 RepID=UPI00338E0776